LIFHFLTTLLRAVPVIQLPLADCHGPVPLDSIGMMTPLPLDECSGMALSRKHPGYVWVQNDSGGAARVMGFEIPDRLHFAWGSDFQQVFVEEGKNTDWEDLMMGSDGLLYIADTGNNLKNREVLELIRIPEPDQLRLAQAAVPEVIQFRYEDPESSHAASIRDCEAICQFADGILLFTKRLLNSNCDVFYLPAIVGHPVDSEILTARYLFRINNFRGVTAADSWQDESGVQIVLLGYGLIWLWHMEADETEQKLAESIRSGTGLKIKAGLCESVVFESKESILITNEGRDVFRIDLSNGFAEH